MPQGASTSVELLTYPEIFEGFAVLKKAGKVRRLGVIAMKVARLIFSGRPNGPDTPACAAKIATAVPGSLKRPLKADSWALRSPHLSAGVSDMVNLAIVDENLPMAARKAKE